MLDKLANIFRVPDLRKRVLFTLGLLAGYRIGGHIPTPGINGDRLAAFFEQNRGSVLGFVDLFSGGNLRRLTIFALGILPYITASIILQLMYPQIPDTPTPAPAVRWDWLRPCRQRPGSPAAAHTQWRPVGTGRSGRRCGPALRSLSPLR